METKLSSKGQVVIPATMRRELGLRPGMKLQIRRRGDSLVLSGTGDGFSDWARARARRRPLKEPLVLERPSEMPAAPRL